ncbi:MAG: hypothetical protein F4213_06480 [Boseongicola sp. SB0677_bin_26]|nr:hypothetical protein [Boseongicola sp. SB0665_bin_10]MYG25656.1 hypothetical protein [Boseongicola sp. SB0677_bin_26]
MTARRSRRAAATIFLAMIVILSGSGCDRAIRDESGKEIENGRNLNARQRELLRSQMDGRVHKEERPYYGAAVQPKTGSVSGKPLPKAVEGARGVGLLLPETSDVFQVASAITDASGIPINIRTRYVTDRGIVDVPIGTRMKVDYEGPLSAFLDLVASRMDVAWTYDGKIVTIDRMVRRSWDVALPLGTTTFTSEERESRLGPKVGRSFEIDPWAELEARLLPLAPPPGLVTISREAGRVDVFGPPSVQRSVERVLDETMKAASQRIGLDIAVYFVDATMSDSFGIGFNVDGSFNTVEGAFRMPGTVFSADSSGQGIIISNDGNDISFEALAEDRAVVDYQLASSVVQSGTITPISLTQRQNYIFNSSTEVEEEDGKVTQTNTYDVQELITGLSMTVMPRLIKDRRIHLSLTFDEQTLITMDKLVDTEQTVIQSPKTETRRLENQAVLSPGETLVLSGYERESGSQTEKGFGLLRVFGIGGENKAATSRVRMVLMIRPTVIAGRG